MSIIKERFYRSEIIERHLGIRPFFEDFHKLSVAADIEYPRHQHSNYEVILVEKGPYCCDLNGVELSLQQHQVLIIKPGDWHQDHLRAGQFHYVLHFHLKESAQGENCRVFVDGVSVHDQICEGRFSREVKFFEELGWESENNFIYSPSVQDSLLEVLYWRIVRRLPERALSQQFRRQSDKQAFTGELYRLFERNLGDEMDVNAMAQQMHLSRRSLTQKCVELIGDSPAHALASYKIDRAIRLLTETSLPIKDISFHLGFPNQYHFSRVFKRIAGKAPSAFR